jgi:hypothetical protein
LLVLGHIIKAIIIAIIANTQHPMFVSDPPDGGFVVLVTVPSSFTVKLILQNID